MTFFAALLAVLLPRAFLHAAETPETLLKTAQQLHQDGALSRAMPLYQQFLTQYPDHSQRLEVHFRLARAYDDLGQIENAMAQLKQVVESDKKNFKQRPEAFYLLGKFYAADKKYDEAVALFEKMLGEGAGLYEDEVMNLCAGYYALLQKYDEAAAKFNILRLKRDSPLAEQAAYKLALLWLKAEKSDLAVAAISDLAQQFPQHPQLPELLLKAADLFRTRRQFDKTISLCEQLKLRYPKSLEALAAAYLLGLSQRDQKEFPKAVETLEAVGRVREFQGRGLVAEALLAAADIYYKNLNDLPAAMRRYEEAAKYARDSDSERRTAILEQCYFRLAEHHFAQKQWGPALDYYLLLRSLGSELNVLARILTCQQALGTPATTSSLTGLEVESLQAKITANPGTTTAAEAEVYLLDRKLADALRRDRGLPEVAAEYEKLLAKYPREVLARENLAGHAYLQMGAAWGRLGTRDGWTNALKAYERCLATATAPDALYRVPALENLALAAERLGDKSRAQRAYQDLLGLATTNLETNRDDRELEQRCLEYLKSLATRADTPNLIDQSIGTLKQMIETKGALSDLSANARYYLGELYYLKKDYSGAAAAWQEYLRIYGPKQDARGDVRDAPWKPARADERVDQLYTAATRIAHAWRRQGHDQNLVRAYEWVRRNFPVQNPRLAEAEYWLALEGAKGREGQSKEAKRRVAEALWKNVVNPSLDFTDPKFRQSFHFWVSGGTRYAEAQEYVQCAMLKAGQAFSDAGARDLAAGVFQQYLALQAAPAELSRPARRARSEPTPPLGESAQRYAIARYALAREYAALGDTDKLVETCKPYLTGYRQDRFRVSALKLLGYQAGRAGQADVALAAYATLLDEYGESPADKNGNPLPVPARERLRPAGGPWDGYRLAPLDPADLGEIRYALGHLYWKNEQWAKCAQTLAPFLSEPKLAKTKVRAEALYMAGQSAYHVFDFAAGVRFMQALLREYPRFEAIEEAYLKTARGLAETKNWTDLALVAKTFVAEWPKSDQRPRLDLYAALAQLGQGQLDRGRSTLASLAQGETFEDVKADAAYHLGLVTLRHHPGAAAEALRWFEQSLQVYPRETAALEAARCCMQLKQWDKARAYADRVLRDFPKGQPAIITEARGLQPAILKELAKPK